MVGRVKLVAELSIQRRAFLAVGPPLRREGSELLNMQSAVDTRVFIGTSSSEMLALSSESDGLLCWVLFCPALSVFPPSFLPSFLCAADADKVHI